MQQGQRNKRTARRNAAAKKKRKLDKKLENANSTSVCRGVVGNSSTDSGGYGSEGCGSSGSSCGSGGCNGSTNTTKSKAGGTSKALLSKQLANKCVALKKQKARHKQDLTWYRAVLGKGKSSSGAKGGGCKGNGKGRGKGQRLRGTRK